MEKVRDLRLAHVHHNRLGIFWMDFELTFSGSTPMSSQNFSIPSGPTMSSVPANKMHFTYIWKLKQSDLYSTREMQSHSTTWTSIQGFFVCFDMQ